MCRSEPRTDQPLAQGRIQTAGDRVLCQASITWEKSTHLKGLCRIVMTVLGLRIQGGDHTHFHACQYLGVGLEGQHLFCA